MATAAFKRRAAFTLMELMMVVAIIGLIMAMGIPSILLSLRQAPLRNAVNGVLEICTRSRDQAILARKIVTVTFEPKTGLVQTDATLDKALPSSRLGYAPATSIHLDSSVSVQMLDIDLFDETRAASATMQFYPNGTCDEMTLVVVCNGQYREISMDPTTALASVEIIR
ncbi:MAG: prepilin-type N-terminal cleavage/methylation domain-containing protein [Verrucomicrobia bacterium]|nr:prepilin-type N-terminal cleavage/methylation domain-containing protein [Verrucomicrobiota bacterium]MDE3098639.1 prepilin-type N-terminal cleavage/methylation domain-containing protein [Verrucomicrobiota bacterium]